MTPYEIREIPIEELQKVRYNPRKNLVKGDPEYEGLRRSIEELGMIDPLV